MQRIHVYLFILWDVNPFLNCYTNTQTHMWLSWRSVRSGNAKPKNLFAAGKDVHLQHTQCCGGESALWSHFISAEQAKQEQVGGVLEPTLPSSTPVTVQSRPHLLQPNPPFSNQSAASFSDPPLFFVRLYAFLAE